MIQTRKYPKKGQMKLVISSFFATLIDHTGHIQPFGVVNAHKLLKKEGYFLISARREHGRTIELWELSADRDTENSTITA